MNAVTEQIPLVRDEGALVLYGAIAIQSAVRPYREVLDQIAEQAKALDAPIQSKEVAEGATALIKFVRDTIAAADKVRKEMVGPLNENVKIVNGTFKEATEKLESIQRNAQNRLSAWLAQEEAERRRKEEAERRAAEERALRDAEALQAAGDARGAESVLQMAAEPVKADRGRTVVSAGAMGAKATVRYQWTAHVEALKAVLQGILDGVVPADVIEFRQKELNEFAGKVAKEGSIYGLKIEHKPIANVR